MFFENLEVHRDSKSQWRNSLGSVEFHSLTLSHTFTLSRAWNMTFVLPSWLASLQALALVVSPRLKLWQCGCIQKTNFWSKTIMWFYDYQLNETSISRNHNNIWFTCKSHLVKQSIRTMRIMNNIGFLDRS